ncbi:metal-dependent hydrolase [Myxococcota bacterium]
MASWGHSEYGTSVSPIIHAEMGWLVAQPLARRRDRILVMALGLLPDLDGLGILLGAAWYAAWHHRLLHGFPAAILVTGVGWWVSRSWRTAVLALLAFHIHIAADLVGSGPGWPVFYMWPLSDQGVLFSWQWDLASWQNSIIGLAVTLMALGCALVSGRTPVEVLSREWDARVVETIRQRFRRRTQG